MDIYEISNKVSYVGVDDHTTTLFEGLWTLPKGASYNSYLVDGGDKVALIDTVDASCFATLLANIKARIGDRGLDYLVVNHMEPDHSGSISLIKAYYPGIEIVGNAKTAQMIKGFYGIDSGIKVVADGETLPLGDTSLSFHFTPMLHWPETMMTFLADDGILFSGDAFGCFGALNGALLDTQLDLDGYYDEMTRYYACIVAKYGIPVKNAAKKLSALSIKAICPTHGPVWTKYAGQTIERYMQLANWDTKPGVVIAYGSMHGSTQQMAQAMAHNLAEAGVGPVVMHNLCTADMSVVLRDICTYGTLVLGSPTYNAAIFPPVAALIEALKNRGMQRHTVGCFGCYTWSPGVSKKLAAAFEDTKNEVLEPFEFQYAPHSAAAMAACQKMCTEIKQAMQQ